MLTTKQRNFFQLIEEYYKETKTLPNLNILKKLTNYKSYNTIHKYLDKLEDYNYLKYDKERKEIIYLKGYENNLHTIPFINKTEFIKININNSNPLNNYVALKINNNNLKNMGINRNDILIIEKSKTYLNNKFVLVNIKNKYKVFKYQKKDGFTHLINDKNIIPLINNNPIIGKVILLIRDMNI